MSSFLPTMEFDCAEAVAKHQGNCWKNTYSKISNALKQGFNVKIISSTKTKSFTASSFKSISLRDRSGLLEVLQDEDSIFTDIVREDHPNCGYTVVSKRSIQNVLRMAEPLFKDEIVFQEEKSKAEAEKLAEKEKAELREILKSQARLKELTERYPDMSEATA